MKQSITIAGGGLAGLSLGIALRRRNVPVSLWEAGSYPRHRVCGEFIRGVASETLERLGVDVALADAGMARSCRWFDTERQIRRDRLPSPARTISRFRLDARLAESFARLGGELSENSRYRDDDAKPGIVRCTGRARRRESNRVGLKAHFRHLPLTDDLEMHRGRDAYVGLCQVENDTVNVCGLFSRKHLAANGARPDLIQALDACGLSSLSRRLQSAELVVDSACAVAALDFGHQPGAGGERLVLGDAYAMIPPFTGNGMSMALESAAEALDPLVRYAEGALSWEAAVQTIQTKLRRRFRLRLRAAGLLHPFVARPMPGASSILASRLFPFARFTRWLS